MNLSILPKLVALYQSYDSKKSGLKYTIYRNYLDSMQSCFYNAKNSNGPFKLLKCELGLLE